jgi:hypothetical protein
MNILIIDEPQKDLRIPFEILQLMHLVVILKNNNTVELRKEKYFGDTNIEITKDEFNEKYSEVYGVKL